jgi:hypothetical protein
MTSQGGSSSPQKNGKQIRFADTTKTSGMTTLMRRSTTVGGENQKRMKAILSDEHE